MSYPKTVAWAGAWVAAVAMCLVVAAAPAAPAPTAANLEGALRGGVRYLQSRLDAQTGRCVEEFDPDNPRFGAKTALIAQALLAAGADPQQPPLSRSIAWLTAADLKGVYPVSLRVMVLTSLEDPKCLPRIQEDAQWLIQAAGADGGYTYTRLDGGPSDIEDNFNSQAAALAVEAAQRRGVAVGAEYWQRVWDHWVSQQQGDGGWGYRLPPGSLRTHTYGSMTASGLAVMLAAQDRLDRFERDEFGALSPSAQVAAAQEWMAQHFTADQNPGHDVQDQFYWLYAASRAGQSSGAKRFGSADWFADGAGEILWQRNSDGSFGRGDRLTDTALAVLFLSSGHRPLAAGKLCYSGRWNSRPRDLASLSGYLTRQLERPVGWQVVSADGLADDFADAPILYVSGSGPIELGDAQIDQLRQYVLRGGLIVSEAATSNGDFTMDIRRLYQRMFPDRPLERLADDHPVYSAHFQAGQIGGLMGVSNGARLLAIHSPRDLSTALQAGLEGPEAQLMANIYLYATDRSGPPARGALAWPALTGGPGRVKVAVARVEHGGNCNPEPLAWERLMIEAHNQAGVDLEVAAPLPPAALDARLWPVAVMSGTEDFHLDQAARSALGRYLRGGGTLMVEAVGGSERFAQAVRREVFPLVGDAAPRPIEPALALRGPWPIDQITWRRDLALSLGPARHELRLTALYLGERPAIVFSAEDLTEGLLGAAGYQLRGYAPPTARAIMTNLLVNLQRPRQPMNLQRPRQPASAASQPAPAPAANP